MTKKKISILGTGCKKCKKLLEIAEKAVKEAGKEAEYEIEYITEIEKFADYDVFITPALKIEDQTIVEGGLITSSKLIEKL